MSVTNAGRTMKGKETQRKMSLRDVNIKDKRILMRAELNVPLDGDTITSNLRIKATIPTIEYCINNGARSVAILSHVGKPGNQRSLLPVAKELRRLLERDVIFVRDCIGPMAEEVCLHPKEGAVILLENVRFHIEEEGKGVDSEGKEVIASYKSIAEFRRQLSKLGDIFVNDAFGVMRRLYSSMVGINLELRVAGLLLEKELKHLSELLHHPKKPFLFIIGGAKVADKIKLILNLLDKVDEMIIGGAMAFTFLRVLKKMKIGRSIFDENGYKTVHEIMDKAARFNVRVHFPVDFVSAPTPEEDSSTRLFALADGIPDAYMGLDCGPASIRKFSQVVNRAGTIFWNGPMGVFERTKFSSGTRDLLAELAAATKKGAKTVIGGGDTGAACEKFGRIGEVSHVCTGGGASIAFLEGRELPGVNHLTDAPLVWE